MWAALIVQMSVQGRPHVSGEGAGAGAEGETRSNRAVSGRRRPAQRRGGRAASCWLGWCAHCRHGNTGSTQSECSDEGGAPCHFTRNYQVRETNVEWIQGLCSRGGTQTLSSDPQRCNHARPGQGFRTDPQIGQRARSFLWGSNGPGSSESCGAFCRWVQTCYLKQAHS